MNKFTKALKAFYLILRKPWLLNHILHAEENVQAQVIRTFGFKNGLPVVELTELFGEDFDTEVNPYAFLDGSCTPMDIALLRALARRFEVQKYLEIGTWRGESVANVAAEAPNCITINLPDETMIRMGLTADYVSMHRFFSGNIHHVTHIQSHSLHLDWQALEGPFDMIFIDGDHHSRMVEADSSNVFKCIDPSKTIVVWHDYAYNPEKIRWNVLKGILAGVPKAYHNDIYHVSHTLCAVYIPRNFGLQLKTRQFTANMEPPYSFSVRIRAMKN
jgi:predicted O-methyltransferase YrrM